MKDQFLDRREFVSQIGLFTIGAGLLSSIGGSVLASARKPEPVPLKSIVLDLAKPEHATLTHVGGALKIPDPWEKKRFIIVCRTSDETVAAVSSKCTHLGCDVTLPVNNLITCPCHGSVFDLNGKVLHGPAEKSLYAYSATLHESMITIQGIDPNHIE
jgi:cytochrome b6-f complex iron-sulfur subunit